LGRRLWARLFVRLCLALFSAFLRLPCCTFVGRGASFGFRLLGFAGIEARLDILFGCGGGSGEGIGERNLRFFVFVGLVRLRVIIFAFLLAFLIGFFETQMMNPSILYFEFFLQFFAVLLQAFFIRHILNPGFNQIKHKNLGFYGPFHDPILV